MELTVFNERDNSTRKVKFSGQTVGELLEQLKINPEVVIVVRNDEVITESERLSNKNCLELLSIVSGG